MQGEERGAARRTPQAMASASARRIDPHAVTSAPRGPRPRPRAVAGAGQRIRWDRVGRLLILVVFVGLALLYVGPVTSYVAARGEAAERRSDVDALRQENRALRARRIALERGGALEVEARRLGMVRPTERAFVVENLPKGP